MRHRAVMVLGLLLGGVQVSASSLDDQIAAAKKAIAEEQVRLDPKVRPLLVNNDFRFWVGPSVINQISAAINGVSPITIGYQTTSSTGQLKNSNGGALGCGWYVELDSPNAGRASVAASNFGLVLHPSALDAGLHLDAQVDVNIHGHVKAPGSPLCWPPFDCSCPLGGGFGIHTPVRASKGQDFSARATFQSSSSEWLSANVGLTSPDRIDVTLEVILRWPGGSLGVAVPIHQSIPKDPFLSQRFSGPILSDVSVKVTTPIIIDKKFSIETTPASVDVGPTGIQVLGGIQLVPK